MPLITGELFENYANSPQMIIMFSATWCSNCLRMIPIYVKLSTVYPTGIFLLIDVDQYPTISNSYFISAIPTFVFIKNGIAVFRLIGGDKDSLAYTVKVFYDQVVPRQKRNQQHPIHHEYQYQPRPGSQVFKFVMCALMMVVIVVGVILLIMFVKH